MTTCDRCASRYCYQKTVLSVSPRKAALIHVTITHKDIEISHNAVEVLLQFTLPSYVVYEHFTSNGSRHPDDVTMTRDDSYLSITMKVMRKTI